jgi:hypothetical protein
LFFRQATMSFDTPNKTLKAWSQRSWLSTFKLEEPGFGRNWSRYNFLAFRPAIHVWNGKYKAIVAVLFLCT